MLVSAEWLMCPVFLFFSRTCLCTQSSEGCWLTANSNCPEAIGSHFQTGSFIFPWKRKWSLAVILNHPPAAVYKVIREAQWQAQSHTHMHVAPYWRAETFRECGHVDAGLCEVSRHEDGRTFLLSIQVHAILRWNWSSNYTSELWFVLPFVVLPFKERVRDSCGCAGESRDQRRRREKMRGVGRKGRGGGSEEDRDGKGSGLLRITRQGRDWPFE